MKYKYGEFEIFIQQLGQFLSNLARDTGDIQITEITLKEEYFDRARAYLMDSFHVLTNDLEDEGCNTITFNTQYGSILFKRGKE